MPELDLTDESVVTQIISEIDNTEEIERKRNSYNSYQVYSGNIKPYVRTELQRIRPKSWPSYTISDISVSKMVMNKKGKAYFRMPMREVSDNNDALSDIKTDALATIYEQSNADRQFKEYDLTFNRERQGLMWVNYRMDKKAYELISLAPYEFSVIRNKDYGDLMGVVLQYPDTSITQDSGKGDGYSGFLAENQADAAGQSKVYAMWSKDHHVVIKITKELLVGRSNTYKRSITYVPIEGNPNNINPLGRLPFVYQSMDNSPEYPTENPITEQTITFNALWSELLTAANIQGSGQLILSYPEDMQGKLDQLTTGLTSAIELPQSGQPGSAPTTATYISPSPDLSGQQAAYSNYLRLVLSEHGISSSQGLDGSIEKFSSGLERMVAQADVQSIISENQDTYYQKLEREVFEIIKAWDRLMGINNFSQDDQVIVRFPKPKVMVSDSETLGNIKIMLDIGAIERWEMLQKIDPNLSESQAKEKLLRIEQERQQRAGAFLNGGNEITEPRPGESSSDDEESSEEGDR